MLKKNSDAAGTNGVMNEEIVEDLEDFGNKKKSSVNGPRPIVRCYEVNNKQHLVKTNGQVGYLQRQTDHSENVLQELPPLQQNALSSENIDRNVDYQGWLELKKRKWKDTLERRKKQRYALCFLHIKAHLMVLELFVQIGYISKCGSRFVLYIFCFAYFFLTLDQINNIQKTRVLHLIINKMIYIFFHLEFGI